MRRIQFGLVAAMGVGLTGCSSTGAEVGNTAPELKLETLADGKPVKLSDFAGKVVVLDFWATWCGPCLKAMPKLAEIQESYGDKVQVLAVSSEDKDKLKKFLSTNRLPLKFVRDPFTLTTEKYGVSAYPTTFVIGKDGKIAWKSLGMDEEGLQTALRDATK